MASLDLASSGLPEAPVAPVAAVSSAASCYGGGVAARGGDVATSLTSSSARCSSAGGVASRRGSSAAGVVVEAPAISPSLRSRHLFGAARLLKTKGKQKILQEGIRKLNPRKRRRARAYSSAIFHTLFFAFGGWGLMALAPSGGAPASSRGAPLVAAASLSWEIGRAHV